MSEHDGTTTSEAREVVTAATRCQTCERLVCVPCWDEDVLCESINGRCDRCNSTSFEPMGDLLERDRLRWEAEARGHRLIGDPHDSMGDAL